MHCLWDICFTPSPLHESPWQLEFFSFFNLPLDGWALTLKYFLFLPLFQHCKPNFSGNFNNFYKSGNLNHVVPFWTTDSSLNGMIFVSWWCLSLAVQDKTFVCCLANFVGIKQSETPSKPGGRKEQSWTRDRQPFSSLCVTVCNVYFKSDYLNNVKKNKNKKTPKISFLPVLYTSFFSSALFPDMLDTQQICKRWFTVLLLKPQEIFRPWTQNNWNCKSQKCLTVA